MPTTEIDFKNITPHKGGVTEAFEELCCQIARRCADVPQGSEFIRYRGAGGDGGVECLWRLPNGDEWGWQSKSVFSLRQAKPQIEKSLSSVNTFAKRGLEISYAG